MIKNQAKSQNLLLIALVIKNLLCYNNPELSFGGCYGKRVFKTNCEHLQSGYCCVHAFGGTFFLYFSNCLCFWLYWLYSQRFCFATRNNFFTFYKSWRKPAFCVYCNCFVFGCWDFSFGCIFYIHL